MKKMELVQAAKRAKAVNTAAKRARMRIEKSRFERQTNFHVKRHEREETSLLLASRNDDDLTVGALITAGAQVNVLNEYGETPLHIASSRACMDVVNKDEETDEDEKTPLHIAASEGHREIVELLIKAGADINAVDKHTETPLHIAAYEGHREIVELLIKAGADINAANHYGETPLYKAASDGHREVVELLIEAGADINAENDSGNIILHDGLKPSIAELLVSHIVRLQAAGLYVSKNNLNKMVEFNDTHERVNKYLQQYTVCKEEGNKLKRENIMLYRLLMESEIAQLCCTWEKSESAFSGFNNPENLKDQYPEYAYILINKANEVRKEIFLHNHRSLVDALSMHYEWDVKRITFAGMKHFFNIHSVDFKEKLGSGGLTLCSFVDLQDVKERHIPKLKALAFETFLSKCCMKKKSKLSNH